jgi:hypothetical protein
MSSCPLAGCHVVRRERPQPLPGTPFNPHPPLDLQGPLTAARQAGCRSPYPCIPSRRDPRALQRISQAQRCPVGPDDLEAEQELGERLAPAVENDVSYTTNTANTVSA